MGLDLNSNGLTGRVPPEVRVLSGLKYLYLRGNSLRAPLPDVLLHKFDEGQLNIEPLSLIHDVKEVFVDLSNSALLCWGYRATIAADGSVRF